MMRQWRRLALLGTVALAAFVLRDAGAQGVNPGNAPNYYPLTEGNSWHYKLTANGQVQNYVSTIGKIEAIDGLKLARLDAAINGATVATEHLLQNDRGVFRHRNNGVEVTPPLCLLKYPVKFGEKWDGEVNLGKEKGKYTAEVQEENVEVPAGKYKAARVVFKIEQGGQAVNITYWFVQNVGFVKQTVDVANVQVSLELAKFEQRKP